MKVILLKNIPNIGQKYDIKEVNDGYVLNFLLPKKLVEIATPKAIIRIEKYKKEVNIEKEIQEDLLLKNLEELKKKTVIITSKTNEKGYLFSAIHKKEILEAMMKEHHINLDENSIILEKPIKEVGEFDITIEIPITTGEKKQSSFKLKIQNTEN